MEYRMKILDKYIEPIKNGIKTKEFRLNDEVRQKIKIGDTILLISNEEKNNYVRVKVKGVKSFASWENVFNENGENEFLFSNLSLKELKTEFRKYYRNEDVKKYGIVCFDIKPITYLFRKSRVLIDTNTIIYRESHLNVNFEVAELYKWFDKLQMVKLIHPVTREEINNYGDEKLKASILSKLNTYQELTPSEFEDDYFNNIVKKYSQDKNSLNDNSLLLQVYLGVADYLVTNDKLLIQKAKELYLDEKVLTITSFLRKIEEDNPDLINYNMLSVRVKKFGELDSSNVFFDTLREDYPSFNDWFLKKNNESAYVFETEDEIKGFLYLKVEDKLEKYFDFEPVFDPKKRLKVGTFKIDSTGFRLGERFLKIIFDNAIENNVDEVYVTMFEEKREEVANLKNLMMKWGFALHGYKKSTNEIILVKDMKRYNKDETPKFNFPLVKEDANFYFLPIYSNYHTDLFPDSILKNENMNLYKENLAHRYSIEKIYVTKAFRNPNPGDIVLIYRTGDRYPKRYSSVLSGRVIIQEVIVPKSLEEYLEICDNKSVFHKEELIKLYQEDGWKKIIKILYLDAFDKKIILNDLHELNIVEAHKGPRIFDEIKQKDYDTIIAITLVNKS